MFARPARPGNTALDGCVTPVIPVWARGATSAKQAFALENQVDCSYSSQPIVPIFHHSAQLHFVPIIEIAELSS